MKKLLAIVVLGLLLSGNAYAKCVSGDCKNGYGMFIHDDDENSRYIGDWKNGREHGRGTVFNKFGDIHIGEFKDGKMEGEGILILKQGAIWVGEWKNSKMEGEFIIYEKNGRESFRMNCKKHDCEIKTINKKSPAQ